LIELGEVGEFFFSEKKGGGGGGVNINSIASWDKNL
jgi:hypothetical protein